jgi:CzcA family heavy metal efflux pump
MMRWIVGTSLKFRLLVGAAAAALLALGIIQLRAMPVEALPEFGPVRVEVQTESLGLSAEEVEQLITNPLEQEFFNGLPWLAELRSSSINGLSSIEMVFEPGTDVMRARQVVQERLTMVPALPAASSRPPFVIQPVSATSRFILIGLSSKNLSPLDVGVLARWKLQPRLLGLPGVANVAIWGHRDRQLQVLVDPVSLRSNRVTLDQVIRTTGNALWVSPLTFVEASTPGTGGFLDTANQRIDIQHTQPIKTAQDLSQVTIEGAENTSLRLGDVARVVENHQPLIGDAVVKDEPSMVLVVERFPNTSVAEVTRAVEDTLQAMAPGLPGLEMDTSVFRPATFLENVLDNLARTSIFGLILLVLLFGAFFFDWRAALISVVAILLSFAAAVVVLSLFGATLNMMIVAGLVLAVAVVVDDAVIDIENIRRRLRQQREAGDDSSRAATVLAASLEMRSSVFVATVVIALSIIPVLLLDGVAGSLIGPLGLSYGLAVLASMVVALTAVPVLGAVLLSSSRADKSDSPLASRLSRGYDRLLPRLLRRPVIPAVTSGVLAVTGLAALAFLGGLPLAPALQDRNLLIRWEAVPGVSLPEMDRITAAASAELRSVSGVRNVGALVGRAITSDQVAGVDSGELWVTIDPQADYGRTVAAIQEVVAGYPGLQREVLTYPEQRLQRAATGVEEPVVVRVYGNDFKVLNAKAEEVRQAISGIDGVTEPRVKSHVQEPTVEVEVFIEKAARHGLKPGDVRRAAATLMSGITAGSLFEQQKVFNVVVWATPPNRQNLANLRQLLIDKPDGSQVRLGEVADVRVRPNPTAIQHDKVSRSLDVVADVQGRDLASVVRDVDNRVRQIAFPREHHLEVLGDAVQQQSARQQTLLYIIAAAIGIFFVLQAGFGSWRLASLFFLVLPVALAGGALAAYVLRDSMSAAALLGLLAVLAVATRSTILLIRHYQRLEEDGMAPGPELVLRGSRERFQPIVMGALASALALTPLVVLGIGSGLEIVQPMAAIVISGLLSTTLFTLFVLPIVYLWLNRRHAARPDAESRTPEPNVPSAQPV